MVQERTQFGSSLRFNQPNILEGMLAILKRLMSGEKVEVDVLRKVPCAKAGVGSNEAKPKDSLGRIMLCKHSRVEAQEPILWETFSEHIP